MQTMKEIIQNHNPSKTVSSMPVSQVSTLNPKTSSNLNSTADHKRIDRLFLRFAALYGQLWRSQFRSDEFLSFAKEEWLLGLRKFDDRVINMAADMCRNKHEMPPTLPKFVDFCQSLCREPVSVIPIPEYVPCNPEIAEAALMSIRKKLNMKLN